MYSLTIAMSQYVTNPRNKNQFIPNFKLRPLPTIHFLTSGPKEDIADYCTIQNAYMYMYKQLASTRHMYAIAYSVPVFN